LRESSRAILIFLDSGANCRDAIELCLVLAERLHGVEMGNDGVELLNAFENRLRVTKADASPHAHADSDDGRGDLVGGRDALQVIGQDFQGDYALSRTSGYRREFFGEFCFLLRTILGVDFQEILGGGTQCGPLRDDVARHNVRFCGERLVVLDACLCAAQGIRGCGILEGRGGRLRFFDSDQGIVELLLGFGQLGFIVRKGIGAHVEHGAADGPFDSVGVQHLGEILLGQHNRCGTYALHADGCDGSQRHHDDDDRRESHGNFGTQFHLLEHDCIPLRY
jgi:hypothetical protein